MMPVLPPLAQVLRALRAEQGVDQLALALAMNCADATYLSRLENGRRTNPSASFLRRYVFAYTLLGCPLSTEQCARLAAVILAAPLAA